MTVALRGARAGAGTPQVEVVARNRVLEAHQLHLAGHSWSAIAERTGYRSAKVCAMAVTAHLQKAAGEQAPQRRQQALELHVQRLDMLQTAYWGAAMDGDVHAVSVVLKIMADRAKVLGLDQPQPQGVTQSQVAAQRTLVIAGTEEEYIAQLQAIVSDDPQRMAEHWPEDAPIDPFGQVHPAAVLKRVKDDLRSLQAKNLEQASQDIS